MHFSLFVCEYCGDVDSVEFAFPDGRVKDRGQGVRYLCTECSCGRWHGLFPKQAYDPKRDTVVNRVNGLGFG
jgi:hypothetical protein